MPDLLDENQCPRCGESIPNNETPGAYVGALSRWDNDTEVCSDCGVQEAMLQFSGDEGRSSSKKPVLEEDHEHWYAVEIQSIIDATTPKQAKDVFNHILGLDD